MPAQTEKVYRISIEMSQAQQQLATAGKLFDDLKTKSAAANQEVKETKEIYKQNADELKQLVSQQKELEKAKKSASAGAPAMQASAALDKNLAEQKLLNGIVQESKIDYDNARAAATAAGQAVGAQATAVKELAGSVKDYGAAAKAAQQEFAPGTIGAVRQEVEQLRNDLENLVPGSAEAAAAIQAIGAKESVMRGLANSINAANPRAQARGFTIFAGALTGVVGISTTAAQVFGLSSDSAQKYAAKMQALVGVLYSVEQVNKAMSSENISLLKSIVANGKAWLTAGESAEAGGKMTRAALISTGIGALIVLVGILIANFDKVKDAGSAIYQKFKPEFDAIGALIGFVTDKARDLASFLTFGLVDNAAKHAQEVALEAMRKHLAAEADMNARLIDILKARGADTLQLEEDTAAKRLASLKNETEEEKKAYQDALRDLAVLRVQLRKRADDEEKAQRLAHLNALVAMEQARGADSFAKQLAVKKEQQLQLADAEMMGERVTQAQKMQLQAEIDTLQVAHDKEQADKRRALQAATLQAQLVQLQASTTEQSLVELKANSKQIELVKQHRATLLAQAQVDRAAVVAADAELYKLRLDRSRIFYRQEAEQASVWRTVYTKSIAAIRTQEVEREKQYQANLNRAQAAGARVTKQVAEELAAELALKKMKAAADADIGGNLLIKLFGLTDAQAQDLKGRLANVANQVGGLAATMLQVASAEADAALTDAQGRLSDLTQQLSAASQTRQADENALAEATGAKREYLLSKIQKEQVAEQKLAGEKAKAARESEAAQQRKAQLEKEQQRLTAAGTLLTNVSIAATAIKAGVEAVAGANAVPFPGNLVAIVAALAATGTAIASAKGLANSLGDGGIIEGGSHASGNDVPVMGGKYRVEGGEAITPVDATLNNGEALELIRTKGRKQKLTSADFAELGSVRVLPSTSGTYGAGGILGGGSAAVGAGKVVVAEADLSALVANTAGMLAHLQTVAATNQQIADYGPASLQIGPYEATRIDLEKQKADQSEAHATL